MIFFVFILSHIPDEIRIKIWPPICASNRSSSGPNIVFQGNWERDDSFILFMILPKYEPWKSLVFSRFMKKKILNDPNVMLLNV